MELVTVNLGGKVRRETLHGREYLVAPMTMIVSGVLNGSQGALFYPAEEVEKDPASWNGVPILLNHPSENGQAVSGRSPSVWERQLLGHVFNATAADGTLRAEGWFDVAAVRKVDPGVLAALRGGRPLEVSTGLFTSNLPAPAGSVHNGPAGAKPYQFIATGYKPDHLAVLPSAKGACAITDGCGVLVNEDKSLRSLWRQLGRKLGLTSNAKPSDSVDVTPEKACKILRDKQVNGKPLTTKQRGMFGVICGKRDKKPTANAGSPTFGEPGWECSVCDTNHEPAANSFCPTGEGGGVDPSCSPGGGGPGAPAGKFAPGEPVKVGRGVGSKLEGKEAVIVSGPHKVNGISSIYKVRAGDIEEEHHESRLTKVKKKATRNEADQAPEPVLNSEGGNATNDEGSSMKLTPEQKAEAVAVLTANCECEGMPWAGKDAAALNAESDEKLYTMAECAKAMKKKPAMNAQQPAPVVNAAPPAIPVAQPVLTAEQFAAAMFPGMTVNEIRAYVSTAKTITEQAREQVVNQLRAVAAVEPDPRRKALIEATLTGNASLDELNRTLLLVGVPVQAQPSFAPNYAGAAAPLTNVQDDSDNILPMYDLSAPEPAAKQA